MIVGQAAQAQTISSRLVAQAHSSSDGTTFLKQDSTAYTYTSSARGGDLNSMLKFDMATKWLFLDDTTKVSNLNYIQEFDSHNNITSSATQSWSGTAWVNISKNLYFYDSTNRLAYTIAQTWGGASWVNVSKNLYTYTSGTQVFSEEMQMWDVTSSTFLPSSQTIYYYDGMGNKTQSINQVYNWTTLSYDYSSRTLNTYSTGNQLLSSTYATWTGSAWANNNMYTYAYDTAGNRISQLYQLWNGTTSAWDNSMLHTYSNFTTMHMAQTDVQQNWDEVGAAWTNVMQYTYTYNGFGQLTSSKGISWNVGGFWEYALGDPKANYYYGPYLSTSVKTLSSVGGNANMYPVPAQNMLHIELNWNEAQAADIVMVDVAGKAVFSYQTPAEANYHMAIPVNNIADGVYVVKINGKDGQIVKQVVIAH